MSVSPVKRAVSRCASTQQEVTLVAVRQDSHSAGMAVTVKTSMNV